MYYQSLARCRALLVAYGELNCSRRIHLRVEDSKGSRQMLLDRRHDYYAVGPAIPEKEAFVPAPPSQSVSRSLVTEHLFRFYPPESGWKYTLLDPSSQARKYTLDTQLVK